MRDPLESGTGAQRLPAAGLAGRRAEELPVDETFHQDNGMPILLEPIRRQTRQAQAQGARGEIGKLLTRGQNDAAAVLRQQVSAPFALLFRPRDRWVARLEVQRRGAPAQQRPPATLIVGRPIAQLFPPTITELLR